MLKRLSAPLFQKQVTRGMSAHHGRHGMEHGHYLQVSEHGHSRIVVLDRPKALNSLNIEMCIHMKQLLQTWTAPDSSVGLFMMKGAGEKAFCAGACNCNTDHLPKSSII